MTGEDRTYLSQAGDSQEVTSFARHVLGAVSIRPGQSRTKRRDAFAAWLAEFVVGITSYDESLVLEELRRARLNSDDLILYSLPQAANILGQRWTCSELGFAHVSLGSARLFGLCHSLSKKWSRATETDGGLSILLATVETEVHLIGPSVLAYRLRQMGHSVRAMTQASPEELIAAMDVGRFHGLLLSSSQVRSVKALADIVAQIKARACVQIPIVLGGSILYEIDGLKDKTGVALTTNDIGTALGLIGQSAETALSRVAE